jgi:5-methylthioribose kinase
VQLLREKYTVEGLEKFRAFNVEFLEATLTDTHKPGPSEIITKIKDQSTWNMDQIRNSALELQSTELYRTVCGLAFRVKIEKIEKTQERTENNFSNITEKASFVKACIVVF